MVYNKYFTLLFLLLFFLIPKISTGQTNSPPEITATGNQLYCPTTPINIVTDITIIDTDDTGIEAMYIQISTGYKNGEDTLTLTGSHPNIITQWDSVTGKLKLFGTSGNDVLYTDFIAAILDVQFNTSNPNATGDRFFSITIGDANYLPSTDHFYEYVPNIGITWTEAKTAAAARTYFGLQGYLATLESVEEAQLSGEQASGAGWIGGSDAETEGVWKWVTGPNPGTIFWNGVANGSTPNYANWNTGEPNQFGDEDYAHITDPSIGIPGAWNDLPNDSNPSGAYQAKGYIVEYGGMPGDPILSISASASIHIPEITSTTENSRCGSGLIALEATSSSGIINWYDAATNGNLLSTGSTFTTPIITSSNLYYVSASIAGCTNGLRTQVVATILEIPTIDETSGSIICYNGTGNIYATPSLGSTVNWYETPTGGISLGTGNAYTTPPLTLSTTYYADATLNGCTTTFRSPVEVIINLPSPPSGNLLQIFCKFDNATIASLTTTTGIGIIWYNAISGGTAFSETDSLINGQKYYASQNDGVCESVDRLEVSVTIYNTVTPLLSSEIPVYSECDTNIDGNDTNGETNFDLTTYNSLLINGEDLADFTFTYFTDFNYSIQIVNPTTFQNTIANGQTIYVRITNNLSSLCYTDTAFEIEVYKLPTIQSTFLFQNCDEDGVSDGFTDFNLEEANEYITNNDATLIVSYYTSFVDADTGSNPINTIFNNSNSNTVYARVETTDGCHRVSTITLQVSTTSFPTGYLFSMETCDDNTIADGLHLFDLTIASADMIAQFPTGQNLEVFYYRNLNDAQLEQNKIIDETNYLNEITFNQTLYVRVESNDNGACFGVGPFLNLTVHPRPDFEVIPTAIVCLNLPAITLEAFNPKDVYSYEWTDQNNTIISNNETVAVNSGGVYTVIATSNLNCESFPMSVTVSESSIATLSYDDVSIKDDSNNNTITIDINNLGIGDYEFALDNEFGSYQDEPFFDMVAPGIHTIYVRDKNNCGIAFIEVSVIGFPKFFTPNNDGYNDTWQILGVSKNFYPSSIIYIYDRFGKIIAKVNPTKIGWDGFYNGQMLPSDDYWFSVQLIDRDGTIRNRNGHFSMIRR